MRQYLPAILLTLLWLGACVTDRGTQTRRSADAPDRSSSASVKQQLPADPGQRLATHLGRIVNRIKESKGSCTERSQKAQRYVARHRKDMIETARAYKVKMSELDDAERDRYEDRLEELLGELVSEPEGAMDSFESTCPEEKKRLEEALSFLAEYL